MGLAALVALLIAAYPNPMAVGSCGISVTAQPSVVNYPSSALPAGNQASFGETLDVNYTSAFVNRTVTVQYLASTGWRSFEDFTGNSVGFTRTYFSLISGSSGFGTNEVRAVSGSCVSNEAAFAIQADPTAIGFDAVVYVVIALLLALFYFGGRRMGKTKFVLLAAAVYLAISPFTGQRYDVYFLISSGIRALQHIDPFAAGTPPLYPGSLKWAYPPLYVPYSSLSYLLYQLFTGASLPSVAALTHPSWLTANFDVWQAFTPPSLPVLVFLLKLPMVASALATGILLGRMLGANSVVVWLANPVVVLVAAVWGQLDPIATLLALAAVFMFERGKPYHAYLLASFGAAVKVWPVLLIPLFFVVSLRKSGRGAAKPLAATLPALLTTLLLYSVFGNLIDNLYVIAYARLIPTFNGAFTVSGLTWQQILVALKAPPVPLFTWVGIPALAAVVVWAYLKRDGDVTKWLVVSLMIIFLTYNFVNPQYFYWIIPFLMLQRRRLAVFAFTLIPIIYMALTYDIFYFVSPAILPDYFAWGASIVEQLKLSMFFQNTWAFVTVSGIVPTMVYGLVLFTELRPKWTGLGIRSRGAIPEDKEGLIAQPVKGRNHREQRLKSFQDR
jgi:hypothetical protein